MWCKDVMVTFRLAAGAAALAAVLSIGALPGTAHAVGIDAVVVHVSRADLGNSWAKGCPVKPRKLRAIDMNFIDYSGTLKRGRLIVHRKVVDVTVDAFGRAFDADFRINSMIPVQAFNSSDNKSMRADNTSAFNCRKLPGTTRWSAHALGQAIDVNPRRNPDVFPHKVLPSNGAAYARRTPLQPGMVNSASVLTRIFSAHGWTWGGNYRTHQDYQHYSLPGY